MGYTVHRSIQGRILSGQPFPSPGDLPNPGIKSRYPHYRLILYQMSHKGIPLLMQSNLYQLVYFVNIHITIFQSLPPRTLKVFQLMVTSSVQLSSVQSHQTLCDSMNRSTPGLPIHHQLPQTHIHQVSDAIQPSHPLSPPSPPVNLSQHQGICK